ncbi:M23 family metallopeptidase [Sphaerisporangium flaviroseum]
MTMACRLMAPGLCTERRSVAPLPVASGQSPSVRLLKIRLTVVSLLTLAMTSTTLPTKGMAAPDPTTPATRANATNQGSPTDPANPANRDLDEPDLSHPQSTSPLSPPQAGREAPAPGTPRWRLPLDHSPNVLRRFAPPAQPWLPGHRGVDLVAQAGQVVRAAGSGIVGYAGPLAGRGVVMIVHPDGLRTTYLPVHASVRHGQVVKLGDVIGVVEERTGHCPASCLHWGLIKETRYLDALLLLGLGQVRLLPRWR